MLLVYVYAGYPLLVYMYARLFGRDVKKTDIEPEITVLITAYNEEADIEAKLENSLKLEYPREKLQILVASDGSTDRTDEIVKGFADRGVEFFRQEGRKGKTLTQNNAVLRSRGEIIVFSDATTTYPPKVLRQILPSFGDETVGCVSGRLIYVDDADSNVGKGAKSYWSYESGLKQNESIACSLIGASGCLYAVRRDAYRPMYAEACSDFLICTEVYRQGLKSVYEHSAVCTEVTNSNTADEMQMRIRVISQTFTDLWLNRDMLNPFKSGFYAVQLISHKVLRYSVPLLLAIIFVTSGILAASHIFYMLLFLLEVIFYLMAAAAWLFERVGRKLGVFSVPMYFMLTNIASAVGFYRFMRGERIASWETVRGASGS